MATMARAHPKPIPLLTLLVWLLVGLVLLHVNPVIGEHDAPDAGCHFKSKGTDGPDHEKHWG